MQINLSIPWRVVCSWLLRTGPGQEGGPGHGMWGMLDHCLASWVLTVPIVPARWTQAGNKTAGASLWSLRLTWLPLLCRAAWPCRSPPPAKGVLVAVWRGGAGGGLWTGGMQAERAQGSPGRGRGSAGRQALLPQPAAVGGATRIALFTGGHGPSGRVCYLEAGQQADSRLWPQRTWRSARGGLTRPGRRGTWGLSLFPSHCAPSLPRDLARLRPSSGNFHQRDLRLMSDLQECSEVTEVGGTQAGVHEPAPGVSLP